MGTVAPGEVFDYGVATSVRVEFENRPVTISTSVRGCPEKNAIGEGGPCVRLLSVSASKEILEHGVTGAINAQFEYGPIAIRTATVRCAVKYVIGHCETSARLRFGRNVQ